MYEIIVDNESGNLKVKSGTQSEIFTEIDQEFVTTIEDLNNVESLKYFNYKSSGENKWRYLETKYRISRNKTDYSEWLELSEQVFNFPDWSSAYPLTIQIKFIRSGESDINEINLEEWELVFKIERNLITENDNLIRIFSNSEPVIIKPPFIYKVFKIDGFELITSGDFENLNIKYRYSQDYGRNISKWEPLNDDNIKTMKINPIRFFQIEYSLTYEGNSSVDVYDINLIGDFQNVTLDSQKTNLLALREDCNCIRLSLLDGKEASEDQINSALLNKTCVGTELPKLSEEEKANLYNPYNQNEALKLWEKMANDANQMFGHEIYYFLTDPDRKGIDYTFNEYQLYNYICDGILKVSVDNNSFPEDNMQINQFDLSLFDSFEIHIMKEDFKRVFGVEKRPAKEDFLWFCEINKMFIVEHARQYRQFNNAAVYYKVMLKKYNQSASMSPGNDLLKEKLDSLTRNSTIDELFGKEIEKDKKSTANLPQQKTLTKDLIRLEYFARIEKELIENSNSIISKTHYQMTGMLPGGDAVVYKNIKDYFLKSDNLSFMCWFNINEYIINDNYNLFSYWDDINLTGIRIGIENESIIVNINDQVYIMPINIEENIWYSFLLNVDQRRGNLSQYLYKRDSDDEKMSSFLPNTSLRLLTTQEWKHNSKFIELDQKNATIKASDMKITNIRIFEDIIEKEVHSKILNQSIIGNDSKYLILADNANTRLNLPNYKLN